MMNRKDNESLESNEIAYVLDLPIKTRIRRSYAEIEAEIRGEVWVAPIVSEKKKRVTMQPQITDLTPEYRAWGNKNTGAAIVLKLNEVKKVEIIIDGIIIESKDFNKIIRAYGCYVGFNIETSFKQEVSTENKIPVIKEVNMLRIYFPVLLLNQHKIKVSYRTGMDRHTIDLTVPADKVKIQEAEIVITPSKIKRTHTIAEKDHIEELISTTGISYTTARKRAKKKVAEDVEVPSEKVI